MVEAAALPADRRLQFRLAVHQLVRAEVFHRSKHPESTDNDVSESQRPPSASHIDLAHFLTRVCSRRYLSSGARFAERVRDANSVSSSPFTAVISQLVQKAPAHLHRAPCNADCAAQRRGVTSAFSYFRHTVLRPSVPTSVAARVCNAQLMPSLCVLRSPSRSGARCPVL